MQNKSTLSITEYHIAADPHAIPQIRERFIEFLFSLGLKASDKEGWKLTFTEAVNNAIEHGSLNSKEKIVQIRWWAHDRSVFLETQDEGHGPSEDQKANPRLPDDPLAEGGRGLFIIHNFSDVHEHWVCANGYTAKITKHYKHLNNVSPENAEMDAIMDELSDCYESLSLYDQMNDNLRDETQIERFIEAGMEILMDSRDYDAVNIEMRSLNNTAEYAWCGNLDAHMAFGQLEASNWSLLKNLEPITWNKKSLDYPFDADCGSFPVGACVPITVGDKVVGLIGAAYHDASSRIRSNDLRHLKALSDIFAITLSRSLMQQERDERKRLSTEIQIATKLQHQLLPATHEPVPVPGYELFINSTSALEVAGDFVEVSLNSEGDYIGCVIDVMGKGVSAAILAGIFRSQFIAFNHRGGSLSEFLKHTNMALEAQLGEATMFITAFVFKLNYQTHQLCYTAAGHPPGLLFHDKGETQQLISSGPPIGLFGDIEYQETCLQLAAKDRLIIVTDGLYEWTQADGKMYGWDAMVEWFEKHQETPPQDAWDQFNQKMRDAREKQQILQEDDETVLILTRK